MPECNRACYNEGLPLMVASINWSRYNISYIHRTQGRAGICHDIDRVTLKSSSLEILLLAESTISY
jgi:hypothetical protein